MPLFKKQKPDWQIFLLGFVTVGVLMTAAIVALIVSNHVQKEGIPGTESLRILQNPVDVQKKYQEDMRALVKLAQASQQDITILFDTVETIFFEVRVPYDMRDAHIGALRQFQALRAEVDTRDEATLRAELVAILEPLTQ